MDSVLSEGKRFEPDYLLPVESNDLLCCLALSGELLLHVKAILSLPQSPGLQSNGVRLCSNVQGLIIAKN